MLVSPQEQELCRHLRELPRRHNYRYSEKATRELQQILFRSLAGQDGHLRFFFPNGPPTDSDKPWSLRDAQGAVEGAEYTEAARGKPCGHIFKSGEATYRCKTCTADDTCVLCARCFDASDHEGHQVYVSVSPGNSGCCDCGDDEAWVRPVHCNIHSASVTSESKSAGKAKEGSVLPDELLESIRMTISRTLDYLIDVFSCSPEQLRLPKTQESILQDERSSRLTAKWYGQSDQPDENQDFCLVLWNDEKHTVHDVRDQVARACKQKLAFGLAKAHEVNDIGRATVVTRSSIEELLRMAKIIEDIKLTVTIRSARDTFREHMGGAIVDWISDIAGCTVGEDNHVLRRTICEEVLKPWRVGSQATNLNIGKNGLDDHEMEDKVEENDLFQRYITAQRRAQIERLNRQREANAASDADEEEEAASAPDTGDGDGDDTMDIDQFMADRDGDVNMDQEEPAQLVVRLPVANPILRGGDITPAESDSEPAIGAPALSHAEPSLAVPETPRTKAFPLRRPHPPEYWTKEPDGYGKIPGTPAHEDLWQRLRLDHLILYDLRMWKQLRIGVRDVFISTVVTIPQFKRLLGLRFAGVYTALAQLYLIADREPDHSIINLSLQMLTTPSITAEIVEKGNFLTNLMAILYTFLTTRQVGYPWDVDPKATLAFEQGAVTNRRMYHFFLDMKYLLGSEHVQARIREDKCCLLQFLDLVKLHQGICPNVRAVGEHLEYETEAWISASLITREINKLCRQFSEAFVWNRNDDPSDLCRAIRAAAKVVIVNSLGAERKRFDQSELKGETKFKTLGCFEFDAQPSNWEGPPYRIVDCVVAQEPMSFHHALHYTLSWLIDRARGMPREQLLAILLFSQGELQEDVDPTEVNIPEHLPAEYLLALFDFPLRVCAWLAQMRASIWVRNGITLRHQMTQYRSVSQRDVSYQRDIFLLQAALVLCDPSVFLASMVDRFGVLGWMSGKYEADHHGFEDTQAIEVVEDLVHLLIILLSDRTSLIPVEDEVDPQIALIRKDIAHVLCFKPLSYSDMTARLSERVQNAEEFQDVLEDITKFRPPEGLSDSGTFELKEEYIELVDPYIHQYSRNQREEAETIYKNHMAKKTGKQSSEIVFEPKLRPISSGLFQNLADFTHQPLFTQIIYYLLGYGLMASNRTPNIPATRIESYIQFVLQLVLVAVLEDRSEQHEWSQDAPDSFVTSVLTKRANIGLPDHPTVFSILKTLMEKEEFKACEPKIKLIMHRLKQRQQHTFIIASAALNMPAERMDTASPATVTLQDKELKKKQALERQARVMASFKEQQGKFMANQDFDWGEELSDMDEDVAPAAEQEKMEKYPSGTCIMCQEETNDQRLFGSFGYVSRSHILRQTNTADVDWVDEVVANPVSLDRSADALRPFGVSGKNRRMVEKITSKGEKIVTERQDLGKGFPCTQTRPGPVSTGCGHIMHYACFEVYLQATQRRHVSQIARNHPERPELKEFMCPLCKAMGNIFLPIIWKGKKITYPGPLETEASFDDWIDSQVAVTIANVEDLHRGPSAGEDLPAGLSPNQRLSYSYGSKAFIQPVASHLMDVNSPGFTSIPLPQSSTQPRFQVPAFVQNEEPREPLIVTSDMTAAVVGDRRSISMLELVKVYLRLKESLSVNGAESHWKHQKLTAPKAVEELSHTDALAEVLGYSIAAVEIAQRGVQSDSMRGTLLDKISPQSLTHLRIFSETVSSYIAVGSLRHGNNATLREITHKQIDQLHQLFIGHPDVFKSESLPYDLKQTMPLLMQDPFILLCDLAVYAVPAYNLDIHHVLRLCYLAELVRVIVTFAGDRKELFERFGKARFTNSEKADSGNFTFEQLDNLRKVVCVVIGISQNSRSSVPVDIQNLPFQRTFWDAEFLIGIYTLASTYALPFLRKAAILMQVRFGVEFPPVPFDRVDKPELDRLSSLLKLPSLNDMFHSFVRNTPAGHKTRSVVGGWLRHWLWFREGRFLPSPITLSHPSIFELVGLPKNYDTLTDEAIRRRCPTTGRELTDPALCLFCGEIMCSQGVCCMTSSNRGGCNQHQAKCGGNIGLFIHIRKCMVLFLNEDHGTWYMAPYLDKHGETDPTLRRHHQLFLNQKRYDVLLRKVWLEGGLQSFIARRLEGDINNGGWETL